MQMLLTKIVAFVFGLVTICDSATETTDLITGEGCGRTSQVAGGVVQSHQPFNTIPPISNAFECYFQMRAVRFNQNVRFMFTHFSLSPNDCSMTNLTFYDGTSDTDREIAMICPDTPDVLAREYLSTSFWLTLKLEVSSVSSANFSGFYVSYTDDRDPCVDQNLELMCSNGRCIFDELECDGLNSCGDNTDEPSSCSGNENPAGSPENSDPLSDLTPLYIILTIAFAMLAAYIVFILLSFPWFKALMVSCLHRCFLFAIRKRRKWRKKDEASYPKSNGKISPIEKESDSPTEKHTGRTPPVDSPNQPVVVPPVFVTASNPNKSKVALNQKEAQSNPASEKTAAKHQAPKTNFSKPRNNPRNFNSSVTNKNKLTQ